METDFYEVLGVSPTDDIAQIKTRYRQMVRENHPDIAVDKVAAHARIQLIIAAWTTLSQPHLRHEYDQRRRQQQIANAPAVSERTTTSASTPSSSSHRTAPVDAETAARKRARAQQVMGGHNPPRTSNPRTRLLTMVFDAAQMYHVEGRTEDAIRVCNNVLRADPTNAEAAVLLGDIYAQQNRKDAALALYERAMRLQPGNQNYRQKWEALRHNSPATNVPPATSSRPTGPNPWSKSGPSRPLSERFARREGESPASATSPLTPPVTAANDAQPAEPNVPLDAPSTATDAVTPINETEMKPPTTVPTRGTSGSEEAPKAPPSNSIFARWRARRS